MVASRSAEGAGAHATLGGCPDRHARPSTPPSDSAAIVIRAEQMMAEFARLDRDASEVPAPTPGKSA
jgi:hypothetical protein